MRIALCGDIHICKHSSIINDNGDQFSSRLENCIKTVNWVEQIALDKKCDIVVYLGDVFDKPELDDETITAVKEFKFNSLKHYFIVGNHESSVSGLRYNSTKVLEGENSIIVDAPMELHTPGSDILLLPYVVEMDRKPLAEYWSKDTRQSSAHHKIIFMHNDIAGLTFGPIVTKTGFSQEDILANCELCIDGHLHNGTWYVPERIRSLGNITGQNFGEDAAQFGHKVMILDTETLEFEDIENPYAFNFYKIDILNKADFSKLDNLKNNAVLSIKCEETLADELKVKLETLKDKIAKTRIVLVRAIIAAEDAEDISSLTMDHIQKFIEFCHEKLDNTTILEEELAEICK